MTIKTLLTSHNHKVTYSVLGKGKPLVFIHGVGMQAQVWQPQIDFFSNKYRVIAVNMAGHNGSDTLHQGAMLPDFVAWFDDFFDALGLTKAVVIGHSMGALIAQGFAIFRPEKVVGVALLSVVHCRDAPSKKRVVERSKALGRNQKAIDSTLARWFGDTVCEHPVKQQVKQYLLCGDEAGYASAYRAFAHGDRIYAHTWKNVKCPVLLITGEDDFNSTPAMSQKLAAMIDDGSVKIIAGQRHMINLTVPDVVNQCLNDWLDAREKNKGKNKGKNKDMKFSLFAHLERVDDQLSQRQLYEQFIDLCKIADKGGMRAIWTGEHHGMNFTIAPNPFINLVDLAHHTTDVRLGTGTIIAPFWHPIKLAGEAAMTDIITNGRLEMGVARGAYAFEYERLSPGLDPMEAGLRMRELIPAVKNLWRGDYAHRGQFWQFPKTTSAPQPQSDIPIWVAARDPNSHNFAVSNRCNVQVTPLWQGDEEVEDLMQKFNRACANNPDVPRPKIMLLRHTYVGSNDADIAQAAAEINRFYNYFGAWFKNEREITQGLMAPLSDQEIANNPMFSPEQMRTCNVIDTPAGVVKRLKYYQRLGYDEYSFWIDSGMCFERKKASLQRFVDEVMPHFA